jgi:pimeloyl-ACP methyl ester carboxylesterase
MVHRRGALLTIPLTFALLAGGCGSHNDLGDLDPAGARPGKVAWAEPEDGSPKGVVILLHGGGWQPSVDAFGRMMPLAASIRTLGYATAVVAYDAGAQGLREVDWVYSEAQRRYPRLPICAYGISAGGHLALMLATQTPDLACVIARAAPTDLASLGAQGAREASQLATDAFGEEQLSRFSPVRRADRIDAQVLLSYAEDDPLVPIVQGRELARVVPNAELIELPPGPEAFVHGLGVTARAIEQLNQRERALLLRAMPP